MMIDSSSSAAAGLYIHVPFCLSKCSYCGFASEVGRAGVPSYLAALAHEARAYRDQFRFFDTLYLGGGTPSVLSKHELEMLIMIAQHEFEIAPDAEITIEVNPGDSDEDWLAAARGMGVNRISLGAQSFNDRELRLLERRHDAAQAEAAIQKIRSVGFDNLGVDLIFGLPGQEISDLEHSLQQVLRYAPAHLSCYQLTIEPNTVLSQRVAAGEVRMPDEEQQAEMFLWLDRTLTKAGYLHYEVSNYSKGKKYRSRHNSKYWVHTPYLGLGPAAHSLLGMKRWWNHSTIAQYCAALSHDSLPLAGDEVLTQQQERLETIMLGLRTCDGVALTLFEQPESLATLEKLQEKGWLRRTEDRVIPTATGMLHADGMASLLA
jgi:oxygen-independent coproporphyrinogen-3 oxidase